MEKTNQNILMQIIKGVLLAILLNLAFVLLFAGFLKVVSLDDGTIQIVNQIAKIAILLIVGIMGFGGEKLIVKCLIFGAATLTLCYIIFVLLSSRTFSFSSLAYELGFGAIVGAIIGIIGKILK